MLVYSLRIRTFVENLDLNALLSCVAGSSLSWAYEGRSRPTTSFLPQMPALMEMGDAGFAKDIHENRLRWFRRPRPRQQQSGGFGSGYKPFD